MDNNINSTELEELLKDQSRLRHLITDTIDQLLDTLDLIYDKYLETISSKEHVDFLIEYSKTLAPQRTAEWYTKRGACITASDIAAVLGTDKYKSPRKVLLEKCSKPKPWSNMYTRWGNKYEPVAAQIYEQENNVKVYEAPLLIHPVYPFIGASCDGFVVDEVNNEAWLIEIKSPFRRVPNGSIPPNYKDQPRTQMAVTKVDRCDFFDCKFAEYYSAEEFEEDKDTKYKGLIFEYHDEVVMDENGNPRAEYIYPPLELDATQQKRWILDTFKELRKQVPDRFTGSGFVYWKLVTHSQVKATRDPEWLRACLPRFKEFWGKIEHYREVGIEDIPRRV